MVVFEIVHVVIRDRRRMGLRNKEWLLRGGSGIECIDVDMGVDMVVDLGGRHCWCSEAGLRRSSEDADGRGDVRSDRHRRRCGLLNYLRARHRFIHPYIHTYIHTYAMVAAPDAGGSLMRSSEPKVEACGSGPD